MRFWILPLVMITIACGRLGFDGADAAAPDAGCDPCPILPGPVGVSIATNGSCYCIDSTEVTQRHYLEYLDAGARASGLAECAWKTSYTPSNGTVPWPPPPGTLDHPVAGVDWCDAAAYCAWAGKRLCGKIGGGPTRYTAGNDPDESQWFRACSNAGTQTFPYGNTYDGSACWAEQVQFTSVVDVASHARCEGAYRGIFDLSGNVNEWEDACDSRIGDSDLCYARGGGKYYSAEYLACTLLEGRLRNGRNTDVGFRCCGP